MTPAELLALGLSVTDALLDEQREHAEGVIVRAVAAGEMDAATDDAAFTAAHERFLRYRREAETEMRARLEAR